MIDWRNVSLLGIDVGYSIRNATTGIAIYSKGRLAKLERIKSGEAARAEALADHTEFDVVAIDGPILPHGSAEGTLRIAEARLSRGAFARRCKPAASHHGFGLIFKRETLRFVTQLSPMAKPAWGKFVRSQIIPDRAVIEAFPNAFLGVLLSDMTFPAPKLKRGKKFDWLYDQAVEQNVFAKVVDFLEWPDSDILSALNREIDHEKRAALVCLLSAACVQAELAEPIGDSSGGWIFLPPKEIWACWASTAVD